MYDGYGGIERFVATLSQILAKKYKVTILCHYGPTQEKFPFNLPDNVKLEFISKDKPQKISLKNILRTGSLKQLFKELQRRLSIIKKNKKLLIPKLKSLDTDIIITERPFYNLLVGRYCKPKIIKIATEHNFPDAKGSYAKKVVRSLKNCDKLVTCTDEMYEFYRKTKIKNKCVLIKNALSDLSKEKSSLDSYRLIAVGRMEPEKDFLTLINVFKKVVEITPQATLTLIGDGSQKQIIKKYVEKLGISRSVEMPGFLNQEDLKKYYLNSCLYVMTSQAEAFALVLTEAMSYGVPCIAFNRASGAREQLKNGVGVLVNGINENEMAQTIINLLNNRNILQNMQPKIESYIKTCSPKRVSRDWYSLLDEKRP